MILSILHFRFIEKLQQDIPGKGVKEQLEILCNIYALFLLHNHLGDFLSTGSITSKQGSLANDQLRSLYSQVCPKTTFPHYWPSTTKKRRHLITKFKFMDL
jgi:hypothetical protein